MTTWIERPSVDFDAAQDPAGQYGAMDDALAHPGRTLLDSILEEFPAESRALAESIDLRTKGRYRAEAEAFARRVGVTWRDVMLANVCYDIAMNILGCSTMALATPRGPVLARNMDWWPEDLLARATFVFRHLRGGEPRWQHAGFPGFMGVLTGLSARGFALCLNAVVGPEPPDPAGQPVMLTLRRVLEEARDYDEALAAIRDTHLAASALLTIVGTRNDQRAIVERSPTKSAVRSPDGDAPLLATNDYRALFETCTHEGPEIYQTTCQRFESLGVLSAGLDPASQVTDEALLSILTDPDVLQSITAQHVVARPSDGTLRCFVPKHLVGS